MGVSDWGNDVYLTIDLELQKPHMSCFGRGALAAIDPNTAQHCSFPPDPSQLSKNWDSLVNNPDKPLINRATQGLYPPGSTFKIITLAAALTNNPEIEKKVYHTPGYVKVKGSIIRDYEGFEPGDYDIVKAFRRSSNSVFIQIGQDVGGGKILEMAESFGFNSSMQTDVPTAVSRFRTLVIGSQWSLLEASIGQGKILATPLQMARVAAIVANGGVHKTLCSP